MADLFNDYIQLKQAAEQADRTAAKAVGAYQQTLKDLKRLHGCHTIKAAIVLQRRKKTEVAKLQIAAEQAMADFRTKWGAQI